MDGAAFFNGLSWKIHPAEGIDLVRNQTERIAVEFQRIGRTADDLKNFIHIGCSGCIQNPVEHINKVRHRILLIQREQSLGKEKAVRIGEIIKMEVREVIVGLAGPHKRMKIPC